MARDWNKQKNTQKQVRQRLLERLEQPEEHTEIVRQRLLDRLEKPEEHPETVRQRLLKGLEQPEEHPETVRQRLLKGLEQPEEHPETVRQRLLKILEQPEEHSETVRQRLLADSKIVQFHVANYSALLEKDNISSTSHKKHLTVLFYLCIFYRHPFICNFFLIFWTTWINLLLQNSQINSVSIVYWNVSGLTIRKHLDWNVFGTLDIIQPEQSSIPNKWITVGMLHITLLSHCFSSSALQTFV